MTGAIVTIPALHFLPRRTAISLANMNHSQLRNTIMLKTVTFTLMHFGIAFTVAYLLTGSVTVGGLVALVEPLVNSVGFHLHEKLWKRLEARGIDGANGFAGWGHRHA